ncbi:hypothetical protein BDW60DRAFT_60566 [Aspergillus nidulans var. acristatus]
MPSFYKKSSPSLVGSAPDQARAPTTESKPSLRSLFSRKARAPAVTEPLAVKAHSRQALAPAPGPDREQQKEPDSISSALHPTSTLPSPSTLEPELEPKPEPPRQAQTQAQTTWEDIDPPTTLLSFAADHSISSASIASRYQQSTHTEPTVPTPTSTSNPTATMLTSPTPSPSTPSLLPSYSDVSGAVVVDAYGTPRFLTPQEEQERKEALAQAVRERMMGLPRRADFSWEASATPVLPRYENAAVAGKLQGG